MRIVYDKKIFEKNNWLRHDPFFSKLINEQMGFVFFFCYPLEGNPYRFIVSEQKRRECSAGTITKDDELKEKLIKGEISMVEQAIEHAGKVWWESPLNDLHARIVARETLRNLLKKSLDDMNTRELELFKVLIRDDLLSRSEEQIRAIVNKLNSQAIDENAKFPDGTPIQVQDLKPGDFIISVLRK